MTVGGRVKNAGRRRPIKSAAPACIKIHSGGNRITVFTISIAADFNIRYTLHIFF